jgi:hypothetical protein
MADDRTTYLKNAEEAEAKAAAAPSETIKRRFLDVAAGWRALAEPPPGQRESPPNDEEPV